MSELYWIVFSLAIVVILVFTVKKGWITDAFVAQVRKVMQDYLSGEHKIFDDTAAGKLFNQLVKYAESAFHAAEQLMHTGKITSEERKATAMVLVNRFAEVDGIELDTGATATVDKLLEAECNKAGHKENE